MKSPEATAKPQCKEFQTISVHSQLLLKSHVAPEVSGSKNAKRVLPYSSRENAVSWILLLPILKEVGKGGDPAVTSWSRSLIQRLQSQGSQRRTSQGSTAPPCTAPQHPDRLTSTPLLSAVVDYAWEPARAWAEHRDFHFIGNASNRSSPWERFSYAHRSAGTPGTGTIVLASIFFFLLFPSLPFFPVFSPLSLPLHLFLALSVPQTTPGLMTRRLASDLLHHDPPASQGWNWDVGYHIWPYVLLGTQPRTLSMLSKHSSNWPTTLALSLFLTPSFLGTFV